MICPVPLKTGPPGVFTRLALVNCIPRCVNLIRYHKRWVGPVDIFPDQCNFFIAQRRAVRRSSAAVSSGSSHSCRWIKGSYFLNNWGDQGKLYQIIEINKTSTQRIIYIMVHIRDNVGDPSNLPFQRGSSVRRIRTDGCTLFPF